MISKGTIIRAFVHFSLRAQWLVVTPRPHLPSTPPHCGAGSGALLPVSDTLSNGPVLLLARSPASEREAHATVVLSFIVDLLFVFWLSWVQPWTAVLDQAWVCYSAEPGVHEVHSGFLQMEMMLAVVCTGTVRSRFKAPLVQAGPASGTHGAKHFRTVQLILNYVYLHGNFCFQF